MSRRALFTSLALLAWSSASLASPASEVLCAQVDPKNAPELAVCRSVCTEWPASNDCLLFRRFGAGVTNEIRGRQRLEAAQIPEIARRAGLSDSDAALLGIALEAQKRTRLQRPPESQKALDAAMAVFDSHAAGKAPLPTPAEVAAALATAERLLDGRHPWLAWALNQAAYSDLDAGKGGQRAAERASRALEISTKGAVVETLHAAVAHGLLAMTFASSGDLASAIEHSRSKEEFARRLAGPDSLHLARAHVNTARLRLRRAGADDVREVLSEMKALDATLRGRPGEPAGEPAATRSRLMLVLTDAAVAANDLDAALWALGEARSLPEFDPATRAAMSMLVARPLLKAGQAAEADRIAEEAIPLAGGHPQLVDGLWAVRAQALEALGQEQRSRDLVVELCGRPSVRASETLKLQLSCAVLVGLSGVSDPTRLELTRAEWKEKLAAAEKDRCARPLFRALVLPIVLRLTDEGVDVRDIWERLSEGQQVLRALNLFESYLADGGLDAFVGRTSDYRDAVYAALRRVGAVDLAALYVVAMTAALPAHGPRDSLAPTTLVAPPPSGAEAKTKGEAAKRLEAAFRKACSGDAPALATLVRAYVERHAADFAKIPEAPETP